MNNLHLSLVTNNIVNEELISKRIVNKIIAHFEVSLSKAENN